MVEARRFELRSAKGQPWKRYERISCFSVGLDLPGTGYPSPSPLNLDHRTGDIPGGASALVTSFRSPAEKATEDVAANYAASA